MTSTEHKCMNCGREINTSRQIKIGTRSLILTPNTKLYIDNDNVPDVRVLVNPNDTNELLLQNITKSRWAAETPSGKVKEVEANGFMPVKNGIKITFSPTTKAEIIA